jgi:prophage maintenance system killer protein
MIQKFYDNTTMQIQKKNEEVYQVESKMQQMENNHQLEIRMYLQKVKHLELEKEKTRDMTMKDATNL